MKNGITGSQAIAIMGIVTVITTWLTFFTRWYDGTEYFFAMVITTLTFYMVILASVDNKVWEWITESDEERIKRVTNTKDRV